MIVILFTLHSYANSISRLAENISTIISTAGCHFNIHITCFFQFSRNIILIIPTIHRLHIFDAFKTIFFGIPRHLRFICLLKPPLLFFIRFPFFMLYEADKQKKRN